MRCDANVSDTATSNRRGIFLLIAAHSVEFIGKKKFEILLFERRLRKKRKNLCSLTTFDPTIFCAKNQKKERNENGLQYYVLKKRYIRKTTYFHCLFRRPRTSIKFDWPMADRLDINSITINIPTNKL